MESNVFKTCKSAIIFICIFIISDRSIGYIIEKLYFKQKTGDLYQTTYAIENAKQDVLIFGSSRAIHHYDSDIIRKKTNLSTYNLGRDGRNMLYHYAVFTQVLTYHRPKIIILDVLPNEYNWKAGKEGEDAMIYALLPYLSKSEINKQISRVRKSDVLISEVFKTYAYNSIIAQILGYDFGVLTDSKNVNGYEPLYGSEVKPTDSTLNKEEKATKQNNENKNFFLSFLSLAKKNNIKVYVIVSPVYHHISSFNCIADLKKTTEKFGFNFYDYSKTKSFNDYTLFYDPSHLNNKGAVLFTDFISNIIK